MRVLIVLALAALASADQTNPIAKVLEMISDLQAKVLAEGADAQKIYEEFAEFCDDKSKELEFEIKTAKAEIEELTATIADATAQISALNEKIDGLIADIATADKDLKGATEVRDKEHADFLVEEKDLVETIDMIERAIAIISREMKGGAFVQLKSSSGLIQALSTLVEAAAFSNQDAQKLTALVQSDDEDAGAPDAAVYESHSAGIVDVLEKLLDKAEGELKTARHEETTAQHNYEQLAQSLKDQIKYGNRDMEDAKQKRSAQSEVKATAEGDLATTSKDLAEDQKSLADLHHDCMTKAQVFEDETTSRGEELKALAVAKKIISEATGGKGGATKQTYGLDQLSLLQVSSSSAGFQIVKFVRGLARKQKSHILAQLASRLSSAVRLSNGEADVFAKVKGLISDMVEQLEKEAAEDAEHKAWCDKELGETRAKQNEKMTEIEKLTTKIDQASAASAKLKEEVATLQRELAALAKEQAEMDTIRAEEHEAYKKNEPEMAKGVEGIKLALKVLREYYAKEDKSHNAAEGAASGIIGLLEVAESDFTKGLTEMRVAESQAAALYEKQTKENEIEKTTKEKDVEYKTAESKRLDKAVADLSKDRDGVQAELDAINKALDSLNEQCVEKAETYEERKRRREAELAGLKEALNILETQAALIQESSTRRLRGAH